MTPGHHDTRTPELIVALDVDSLATAEKLVDHLYPTVKLFKVGSQLFTACGPEAIKIVRKKGGEVFLDLKFHDIPNTVANAVGSSARLKVRMLTLHIGGGPEMLKAAMAAARQFKTQRPLLIGVTVLTSQKAGAGKILKLVKLGLDCGLDGIVCSAREAGLLRKKLGRKFLIITPGIRAKGAAAGDQKRIATPADAVKAGADFIVVGRPIIEAADPCRAAETIIQETIYG